MLYVKNWKRMNTKVLALVESENEENDLEHIGAVVNDTDDSSILSNNSFGYNCLDIDKEQSSSDSDDDFDVSSSDSDDDFDVANNIATTINEDLATCAVRNSWTRASINELLTVLMVHGHDNLPKDARTLLKTPRSIITEMKCGGQYIYLVIEHGIVQKLQEVECFDNTLELIINIDGLPLYRSSSTQLWPILCYFGSFEIFIIAIFCGNSKPMPLEDFLHYFLEEWDKLKESGINVLGTIYHLRIKAFICDAPARAYLKDVILHTGYYSCERCVIKGSWCGRVVFNDDDEFAARSDSSFDKFEYNKHQKNLSPLITSGISCVKGFVLDYMHLACLGVTRRLLKYLKKGPCWKISASQVNEISIRL